MCQMLLAREWALNGFTPTGVEGIELTFAPHPSPAVKVRFGKAWSGALEPSVQSGVAYPVPSTDSRRVEFAPRFGDPSHRFSVHFFHERKPIRCDS